jgi:hypothetical protein
MPVTIRQAQESDILAISNDIRWDDHIEVLAQGYESPKAAINASFEKALFRFTMEKDGRPIAIFGLEPLDILGDKACVWMLGTPDISKIKKTFCKLSQEVIKYFMEQYPVLMAQVDSRYTKTHRWLEWLGARKGSTYKLKNGFEFNDFFFERSN